LRHLFTFILILSITNTAYGQYECSDFNNKDGLIAHYPLDNSGIEALGSGFDGNIIGAIPTNDINGNQESAYQFDGIDDFIHVGDHFDLGESNFTISCWIKVFKFKSLIEGTNSRGGWIVNKGVTIFGTPRRSGYALDARKLNGENYFYFFVGGQNNDLFEVSSSGFLVNKWYNLIGIKDNDSISLYVDNVLIANKAIPSNINVNTNIPLVFGSIDKLGNDSKGTTFFDGKIDEVRIYKKALSKEERNCLYYQCLIPDLNLGEDQTICNESSIILEASGPGLKYKWQDGSTNPTFKAKETGTYWVEVENSCRIKRDTITLIFSEINDFKINPKEYKTFCNETSILLEISELDVSEPGLKYKWQDGSTNSTFKATKTGIYWVEVENSCGIKRDTIEINLPKKSEYTIPNIITPNQDGFNDYFVIDSRFVGSTLKIYQRTGKKVFESTNYNNDWDGSDLPSAVYYWVITDECNNHYKGWVRIIY
jgi:gliding motility-associated-like protein